MLTPHRTSLLSFLRALLRSLPLAGTGAAAAVAMIAFGLGCGREAVPESGAAPSEPAAESAPRGEQVGSAEAESTAPSTALSESDLDAFERGFTKEIEAVRAAKQREMDAETPEDRGRATQEQWEDQTAPQGAVAAGLSPERYREVRDTVTHVLETLDLQGEIEGPMEIDLTRASPEMRQRLDGDAFSGLAPDSAAALRARLDRLTPLWAEYQSLGAMAG